MRRNGETAAGASVGSATTDAIGDASTGDEGAGAATGPAGATQAVANRLIATIINVMLRIMREGRLGRYVRRRSSICRPCRIRMTTIGEMSKPPMGGMMRLAGSRIGSVA